MSISHEDKIDSIVEKIEAFIEADIEYRESHPSAGQDYAHMPSEGDFDYHNGDDRLKTFMEKNNIKTDLDPDEASLVVLEKFSMEPGGIRDPSYGNDDLFIIGSFTVGEIELELDREKIAPEASQSDWNEAKSCSRYKFTEDRTVISSDAVWYAQITADEVKQRLAVDTTPEMSM